jgi:LmbE family N-acetylglucosaminyl deacetylase
MMLSAKGIWQVFRQEVLKNVGRVAGKAFFPESDRHLIIAPHPDDEVFGCGGLLADLTARGKRTDILFITEGEVSHKGCCIIPSSQVGAQRRRLAGEADGLLGVPPERLHFLEGHDGKLPHKGEDGFIELAEKIASCMKKSAPETIFCPHPFEGWPDHVAAEALTMAALKMLAPGRMPHLYHYCVWFWYSMPLKRAWRINWRKARILDIYEQHPLKQKAMQVYLDAIAPCGNPWVGKVPAPFLRAFNWNKELFFEADITN